MAFATNAEINSFWERTIFSLSKLQRHIIANEIVKII